MRTTVIRGAFALVLVTGMGCSDVVEGKRWDLGGPDVGGEDVGSEDVRTDDAGGGDLGASDAGDGGGEDVAASDVGDSGTDLGSDVGPDASDTGPDVGPGGVTVTGWYSSAFEHSGFVADDNGAPQVSVDEEVCSTYLSPEPPAENWWASGPPLNDARVTVDGGLALSRFEATGELSPLGMYGHLGAYDREFVVSEATVLACETAAAAGHCVYPVSGDQCVVPSISLVDPDSEGEATLTETIGGVDPSPITYVLRITYNENVGDGRSDVVFRWQIRGVNQAHVPVQDLEGTSLIVEKHGLFYDEVEYGELDGWVSRDATSGEWRVSVTGVDADGATQRVWGSFDIDETIALP